MMTDDKDENSIGVSLSLGKEVDVWMICLEVEEVLATDGMVPQPATFPPGSTTHDLAAICGGGTELYPYANRVDGNIHLSGDSGQ